MSFPYILAIALALAMDVLAVSLAIGLSQKHVPAGAMLRLASAFGLFQAGMTLIGSFAGENLIKVIQGIDHWVAFGLLLFVGVRMGYESFRPPHVDKADPSKGLALITLAVATSIDALAVGLSLAALRASLWYPAAVIGAVSFAVGIVGVRVGPRIGRFLGRWAELLGGAVLLAIGVRILVTHLAG